MKNLSKEGIAILILTLGLSLFGIAMVYSASHYSALSTYGDQFIFMKKQAVGVFAGIIVMTAMVFFDAKKLARFSTPFLVLSIILLALVFLPVIGVEVYGARRWLNLGFTTIQPSELAKFSLILFTATYLAKNYEKANSLLGMLPIFLVGGLVCLLIMLEPNLSITVCVVLTLLSMLVFGGLSYKPLLVLLVLGLLALPVLIIIEPYRLLRLLAFIDPWASPKGEGYQLIQSLYAIANGGMFGVGYLNSRQGLKFLTFAESDFILSIIAEEFGFLGIVILLSCYVAIFYFGVKIALSLRDRFSSYLAMGISSLFIIQTAINVAVVTGSIPPTGLPLPLISSGNTQIVVFMLEMGVLASLSKDNFTFFSQNPYHKVVGNSMK